MSMWSRYLKDFRSIADYFGNECQSSTECNVLYLIDRAMYSTVLSTVVYLTNFLSLIDICVVC